MNHSFPMRSIRQLNKLGGPPSKFFDENGSLSRPRETNPNSAGQPPRAAAVPVDVLAQVLAPRNLPTRPAKMAGLMASAKATESEEH